MNLKLSKNEPNIVKIQHIFSTKTEESEAKMTEKKNEDAKKPLTAIKLHRRKQTILLFTKN